MGSLADDDSGRGAGETDESLCIGCGLCCDGTFLNRGEVAEDQEAAPLSWYKNAFVRDEGKLWFNIPCPHYDGRSCSIYDKRFGVCRSYRCKLLKKLDDGEISLSEGLRTVATAKELIAAATAHDPDSRTWAKRIKLRKELEEALENAGGRRPLIMAKRLLDFVALDRFIEIHFQDNEKAKGEPVAMADPSAKLP